MCRTSSFFLLTPQETGFKASFFPSRVFFLPLWGGLFPLSRSVLQNSGKGCSELLGEAALGAAQDRSQ